jgi:glucose/arabinose dehydrogenase
MGMMRAATAVIRATLSEDHASLTDVTEIFEQSPPSRVPIHFGSRVVPAPDGTVWITTGERGGTPGLSGVAQDVSTTYGAVVRVTPTARPPRETRSSTIPAPRPNA